MALVNCANIKILNDNDMIEILQLRFQLEVLESARIQIELKFSIWLWIFYYLLRHLKTVKIGIPFMVCITCCFRNFIRSEKKIFLFWQIDPMCYLWQLLELFYLQSKYFLFLRDRLWGGEAWRGDGELMVILVVTTLCLLTPSHRYIFRPSEAVIENYKLVGWQLSLD